MMSEIAGLYHPRAALPGFGVALLANNVLAMIERCVERAHIPPMPPRRGQIRSGYEGLRTALPNKRSEPALAIGKPWPSIC